MINVTAAKPTPSTLFVAVGAAMISGHVDYPAQIERYEVEQTIGTYSGFMENLASQQSEVEHFSRKMAEVYSEFAQGQERLGAEYEAAIFSDLESLYEA